MCRRIIETFTDVESATEGDVGLAVTAAKKR